MRSLLKKVGPLVALIILLALTHSTASAHERRQVGDYEFVVGFSVEPAIEGEKNGAQLRVRIPATEEGGTPIGVEGLEETLQVEITHVPSGTSAVRDLRAVFNDPGHYTADMILTAPGQYRFRFFGEIDGMAVDEVFESGPDTFSDVHASEELQFPDTLPQMREIESAIRGSEEAVQAANDAAASARTMSIVALVVGALGLLVGIGGIVIGRRS